MLTLISNMLNNLKSLGGKALGIIISKFIFGAILGPALITLWGRKLNNLDLIHDSYSTNKYIYIKCMNFTEVGTTCVVMLTWNWILLGAV